MPTNKGYYVMTSRSYSRTCKELIIIIPINEAEENNLDNGHLHCIKEGKTFDITSSDVICYGEIDFHLGSNDFDTISGMNWLDHLTGQGITIPSDYNYNKHCCNSPIGKIRYYDTTNPALVARYAHGCLGKPQRCCIFKEKIYK